MRLWIVMKAIKKAEFENNPRIYNFLPIMQPGYSRPLCWLPVYKSYNDAVEDFPHGNIHSLEIPE